MIIKKIVSRLSRPGGEGSALGPPGPSHSHETDSDQQPTLILNSRSSRPADEEPTLQGKPDRLSAPDRSGSSPETESTAFFSVLDRLLPLPLGQGGETLIDEGEIGRGGMAEVRRVRDPLLGRTMAQKVILKSAETDPLQTARFLEEAQITSQLQHPGVVPVHALGRRPDGRPYFTMKEVRGASLADRIRQVHEVLRRRKLGHHGRWLEPSAVGRGLSAGLRDRGLRPLPFGHPSGSQARQHHDGRLR